MKNFTNNFKQFTSRLSARWLLIAFMFLLGTGGVWAQSWYTLSSDAYFYFNDNVSWTSSTKKAVLLIGRKWNYGSQGVGSNAYSMTNISDTKLQYYKVSAWGSGDGGKYTDIAILSGNSSDGWSGWEGNAVSTRRTYGSKYSAVRNDDISGKTAYYVGTTGANNDPLTFTTYSGYANIPTYTATLAVQTRPGTSGAYSTITSNAPATLKLQGTILSAHGTSSRTSGNAASVTWPNTKTRTAVVTGLVTVSYSSLSAGYTFDGWYEGSTQKSTATSYSYNQSANTTITAKFTAKQFTINYKDQGGENFSGTHETGYPTTHTYGTATTLKTATKTGYTFEGWFTDSNCTTEVTSLGATAYTSNITLYAKWKLDKPTYIISYDVNGGTGTIASQTKIEGEDLTLTTSKPTRTGYTFQNWNTEADGSGTTYEPGDSYTTDEALTLYAQWTANQYAITYKDQSNVAFSGVHESDHPTTHTYGTATTLKSASKAGYRFGGWFTTSACTGTKLTQLSADGYTSAITLYAKWECVKSVTAGTGLFSNGTITLSAKFNTCGNAYIGFQWKKQDDVDWCYTNDGTEKCYIALDQKNISNEVVETSFNKINKNELSGTYVFRPYIVVGNKAEEWLYGEDFTVVTCTSLTAPQLTITPITKCKETYTSGKIVIEGYDPNTYTYVLKKGATPVNKTYNKGYIIANGDQGDYTVVMDLKAGGSCNSVESTGSVNIVDNTPVVETLTMPKDFEACYGQSATVALQNFTKEEGCSYQFTWQYSTNGGTSYTTGTVSNSATSYTRTLNGTTKFRVQVTKSKDGCTSPVATSDAVTVTANSLSAPTVSITSASYDMNAKTFTVSGKLDDAGCSQEIEVGYRYKLSNDDTWSDWIEIDQLTGAGIFTEAGISIAGATAGQTYLFETYAINGYESSAEFSSSTIEVEVQDGYTVYVRRPKSGDATNVYTNWYELSSVKGGAPYVKSGAIQGSSANGQNKATTNNTGGTEMTYAFTDCDGYIWDKFKPAKGDTQFHVHALNDDKQDGWGTFSKTADIEDGKDNYFYLSAWSSGTYGVTITSTDQPTRGVRIKVLGSEQVISNNMASFAAISFNGNCTGKELLKDAEGNPTGFQWKYFDPETSTWSDYDGEGATWNNIRPTAAGKYKLVCTMEDNTTVESNIVTINTTTENYSATDLINIKSALPIIMVNTGDNNGFPACSVAGTDYPSKHADKFKEKLSVDVKIKVGDDIVYDKKARMAYRGSSSLNFKKKSYAFCPGADMCGLDEDKSPDYVDTKKIDMLSLITGGTKTSAKDKDWVLYAATPDPSMMRNILAMETFSAMTGKWGVKNQYVELYVDGVYQGVYVFMDKITQNEKRVNVSWNVDGSSKGFIVKFDKTDLADRYEIPNGDQKTFESAMKTGNTGVISYFTEIDQRFEIEYPEKDKVIKAGGSWADVYTFVKGKIDAFESALKDGDFNTVRTIIDYESWADFFILTEFAKNGDGYRASCVFVYEGGLLKAYPLWDYELSFDNETRQEHGIDKTTGLLAKETTYSKVSGENGTFPAPFWWTGNYYNQKTYKGLLDDPCFISMVNARWKEHTKAGGALSEAKLKELVSKYNTSLTTTDATTNKVGEVTLNTPQKREQQKWPYNGTTRGKTCNDKTIGYYGQGAGSAISEVEDFSASKSTLDTWIGDGDTGRRKGLKAEIDKLLEDVEFAITVVADKTTTTPWRPVTVTVNSNSGYEYSITPEPAKVEENGHMYTLYFARPEGTVGTNFDTKNEFYTFTATTGQADQCGTTQGSTTSDDVKINLADVVENCTQP